MTTTYFCDGLKEISIVNGVVRLEFQRLEPVVGSQTGELRPVPDLRLAIPVQGFAQALGMLEQVRDQLLREGVLKAGPSARPGQDETREDSPNFPR